MSKIFVSFLSNHNSSFLSEVMPLISCPELIGLAWNGKRGVKGTTSPDERCDLGGVKLEKVYEFLQARYEIKVGQILTDSLI